MNSELLVLISLYFLHSRTTLGQTLQSLIRGRTQHVGPIYITSSIGTLTQQRSKSEMDLKASKNALNIMQEYSNNFKNGKKSPVDPYTQKSLPSMDINISYLISGKINLSNLKMKGALNYKIHNLDIQLKGLQTTFYMTIPKISLKVHYDANLYIVAFFPYNPKGVISLVLHDVAINSTIRGRVVGDEPRTNIEIVALHSHVNINKAEITATGLNEDGSYASYVQSFLDTSMETFVEERKQGILEHISEIVIIETNRLLKQFTEKQLINSLLNFA